MQRQATRHISQVLGTNLRTAREEQGLTQHELALAVGSQAFQISRWENGLHRPKDAMLATLAEVLRVDLAWLYTDHTKEVA